MNGRSLSPEQIAAIKRSSDLGRTLQHDHPEIARLWREGYTLRRIVEELDIPSNYQVNDGIALTGVHNAIKGYSYGPRVANYVGLIDDKERTEIGKDHLQKARLKTVEEER